MQHACVDNESLRLSLFREGRFGRAWIHLCCAWASVPAQSSVENRRSKTSTIPWHFLFRPLNSHLRSIGPNWPHRPTEESPGSQEREFQIALKKHYEIRTHILVKLFYRFFRKTLRGKFASGALDTAPRHDDREVISVLVCSSRRNSQGLSTPGKVGAQLAADSARSRAKTGRRAISGDARPRLAGLVVKFRPHQASPACDRWLK